MQWITLIGDEMFDLSRIKAINHLESIESYDVVSIEGRYCVDFGSDHIYYDFDESQVDFEEVLSEIPFTTPHFVTMTFTSEERMRNILTQKDFPHDIYVDNDYGLIVPIEEFIREGMPIG